MDRGDRTTREPAAESTLSGEVTSSHVLAPMSSHCLAWVAATADSRAKSPATKRIASTVWPLAMVKVLAPSSASRCQVRWDGRDNTPSRIRLT